MNQAAGNAGHRDATPEWHDERCCMNGAWPGWGPHPDCPGFINGRWAEWAADGNARTETTT